MFFMSLEGVDGCGKTTTAKAIVKSLKKFGYDAEFVSKKSVSLEGEEQGHFENISSNLWPKSFSQDQRKFGDHYFLFLMAAILDLVCTQKFLKAGSKKIFISDGWYYKTKARFLMRENVSFSLTDSIFEHIRKPDLVFFIDLPIEAILDRKESISNAEAGFNDGYAGDRENCFLCYQNKIRKKLLEVVEDEVYDLHMLNGNKSHSYILDECLSILEMKLA